MKFTFPILVIILCVVASYFTLTQSEKFTDTKEERLEAIEINKKILKTTAEKQTELAAVVKTQKESEDKLLVAKSSVSNLQSLKTSIANEVAGLDAKLTSQQDELSEFKEKQAELEKELAEIGDGITLENLAEKKKEIEADVVAKQAKIEELNKEIADAESQMTGDKEGIEIEIEKINARLKRIAMNSMEARITAVNQDWGFLVIGAGSNSGFEPQTRLLVKRDGKLLGSIKASSIEPTQTIAEIDMKTLAPGVRIQPGDQVILQKTAPK